jgi:hypothetical protein
MATEPAKRVRMLTVIASSTLFRPDGRAAHSARDPASRNHCIRGKSGRNQRASAALSARRTIPPSADDKS